MNIVMSNIKAIEAGSSYVGVTDVVGTSLIYFDVIRINAVKYAGFQAYRKAQVSYSLKGEHIETNTAVVTLLQD